MRGIVKVRNVSMPEYGKKVFDNQPDDELRILAMVREPEELPAYEFRVMSMPVMMEATHAARTSQNSGPALCSSSLLMIHLRLFPAIPILLKQQIFAS